MEAASYVIVSKAAPQYAEIVVDADAADRVAVPVAWIHQCIKTNRLVSVDGYAVGPPPGSPLSESPDGDLSEAEIIQAALATKPPIPPVATVTKAGKPYTAADKAYLHRFLAWKLYNDPNVSVAGLFKELGEVVSQIRRAAWEQTLTNVSFDYRLLIIHDIPGIICTTRALALTQRESAASLQIWLHNFPLVFQ